MLYNTSNEGQLIKAEESRGKKYIDWIMDFEFMDYSETYFRRIKKAEMPRKRSGKFVQIINEATGNEYLVISPKELSVFHANIVERFCMLNEIKGSYNDKKDHFQIHDADWIVIGGGLWAIDEDMKVMALSDASRKYGKFDSLGLKKKILTNNGLIGYTIVIDGV